MSTTTREAGTVQHIEFGAGPDWSVNRVRLSLEMDFGESDGMVWFRLPEIVGVLIPYSWGADRERVADRIRPWFPEGRPAASPPHPLVTRNGGGVLARSTWLAAAKVAAAAGANPFGWRYATQAIRWDAGVETSERLALMWSVDDERVQAEPMATVVADVTLDHPTQTVAGTFHDPRVGYDVGLLSHLPPAVANEKWWQRWSELWPI